MVGWTFNHLTNSENKMLRFLAATLFCCFSMVCRAETKEIFNQTLVRTTGTAVTTQFHIVNTNAGELRISNATLTDDFVELAAATEIKLDGQYVLKPFNLPQKGTLVYALNIGTHSLDVTLRGKSGGALTIIAEEFEPTSSNIGFTILPDGTVLHNNTGLVWHRNPHTPGAGSIDGNGRVPYPMTVEQYLVDFNAGVYGVDPVEGNAGHSDWRLPTMNEAVSLIDYRFVNPSIPNMDGSGTVLPAPTYGYRGGHQYGQPFFICADANSNYPAEECDDATMNRHGTHEAATSTPYSATVFYTTRNYIWALNYYEGSQFYLTDGTRYIWLVRNP